MRAYCQSELLSLTWKQCLDRPHRPPPQATHCAATRSVELLLLGELNCAKSSSEQPSVITEVTAMQSQDMPNGSENARRDPRSVRLATRERLLPTSCA